MPFPPDHAKRIDIGEPDRRPPVITDTTEFFRQRNGLAILKKILSSDGTTIRPFGGLNHEGFTFQFGQGQASINVYEDNRGATVARLQMPRGAETITLNGGVVIEDDGQNERVTFVDGDDRFGITGMRFSRNEYGNPSIDRITNFASSDSADPMLLAVEMAREQAARMAPRGRRSLPAA